LAQRLKKTLSSLVFLGKNMGFYCGFDYSLNVFHSLKSPSSEVTKCDTNTSLRRLVPHLYIRWFITVQHVEVVGTKASLPREAT
jgi:hypothetical protein